MPMLGTLNRGRARGPVPDPVLQPLCLGGASPRPLPLPASESGPGPSRGQMGRRHGAWLSPTMRLQWRRGANFKDQFGRTWRPSAQSLAAARGHGHQTLKVP
jgi:hypothetical protein